MSSIELSSDAAALNEIGKCIVVPPIQQSIKLGNTARGNKYLGWGETIEEILEATVGPEKQAVKKQMKYYRFTTEGCVYIYYR